ncbi:glycoside hydrolase family 3 protein [Microbispora sp. RL4-1S]|uniref:Glycoside hydrolase family 3 protein n=2 Tax=Microbispora oryzae TaxID=2806554 RepID=A0A941AJ36_9ACTN|nr:glycoside hydrolase family 3 protein [Microbispora oryzae]
MAMTVLQPGFDGTAPPDWLRHALAGGLGGVVLFARNVTGPEGTAALVAGLRAEKPDVVVAVDEEGGVVTRMEAATGSSWPGNLALGVADDESLTRGVARRIGRLVAAAGITLDYAPVVDVNADPRNPVIGVRSFGSDPGLVARHSAAWIEGLQSAGVAACAKHFPGHGDTVTDSHLALPTVSAPRELLERRDLPPFRAAVAAGVRAVMCGHLLVPHLDDVPATLSRAVVTGLLREELGFDGLVVTDAIEMRAVAALAPAGEIAVRALAAGVDAVCVGRSSERGESVYALRDAIAGAVRAGVLPEERLAEAAGRVRSLATWYADHAAARAEALAEPGEAPHEGLGQVAAGAALRATGSAVPPVIRAAPFVVELVAGQTQAVGRARRLGLAGALAEIVPGTTGIEIHAEDELAGPPGQPGQPGLHRLPGLADPSRPVVIAVQDAVRHDWMRRLLAEALAARPDAVVVETGIPGPPAGRVYLATHGGSTASARAAARWLTGRDGG